MDNGVGTISGNTIVAGVHDIRVRFSTVTGNSSGATTTISGNTISGRGLELTTRTPASVPSPSATTTSTPSLASTTRRNMRPTGRWCA
jgi:hypothetical protein